MGKRWFCKALKAGRWHSYCPYLWRTLFKTKRDFRAGLGDFGHEQPSRGENKPWLTKCLFTGCAVHLHAASQQVFVWEGNIWYPSAPVWIHSFKFFLPQSWSCCPSFCDRAVRAVQHIMQMGTHAPVSFGCPQLGFMKGLWPMVQGTDPHWDFQGTGYPSAFIFSKLSVLFCLPPPPLEMSPELGRGSVPCTQNWCLMSTRRAGVQTELRIFSKSPLMFFSPNKAFATIAWAARGRHWDGASVQPCTFERK